MQYDPTAADSASLVGFCLRCIAVTHRYLLIYKPSPAIDPLSLSAIPGHGMSAIFEASSSVEGQRSTKIYTASPRSVSPNFCPYLRHNIDRFLPRDAMLSAVLVILNLSVCLSVTLVGWLCPHGSTYDRDFFTVW